MILRFAAVMTVFIGMALSVAASDAAPGRDAERSRDTKGSVRPLLPGGRSQDARASTAGVEHLEESVDLTPPGPSAPPAPTALIGWRADGPSGDGQRVVVRVRLPDAADDGRRWFLTDIARPGRRLHPLPLVSTREDGDLVLDATLDLPAGPWQRFQRRGVWLQAENDDGTLQRPIRTRNHPAVRADAVQR